MAVRDVYERVADIVGLTPEQRLETVNSGQERYKNRIGWAISSLARAEAVARPKRATYTITDVGRDLLEQTVLDLLVAMGYGGVEQRARRIGGSGDGGVDGVIDQDALGLARIYVQAKRYAADNVVGRPQVQGFVGALHGQQADQGVFITTSSFSREAADYAHQVNASVVLIDGARLSSLMIQYGVGVQVENTYTVVKLDEDFFETA